VRKIAGRIKRNIVDFLFDFRVGSCFEDIRREEPVHINFVLHVENIHVEKDFKVLLNFASRFFDSTGVKTTSCVVTPHSYVEKRARALGVTDALYAGRLEELSRVSDIGYHGHFCKKVSSEEDYKRELAAFKGEAEIDRDRVMANGAFPMGWANFGLDAVREQIEKEIDWLRESGFNPAIYVAGGWFLRKEILFFLEEKGIRVDCSLRKYHTDIFGKKYLEDHEYPERGVPFIIPPTQSVVEIQSIFYPVEHPVFTGRHFLDLLNCEPARKLFIVFPSHERELSAFSANIWRNIKMISRSPLFVWTSLKDMQKIISEERLCAELKEPS